MATLASIPASPSRADVNRQNAQHSTGPRTAEGKNCVRMNARTHQLTSKELFLTEDESVRYDELLADLQDRWQPNSHVELQIVLNLRDAMWRRDSISVLQMNSLTLATEEHMEGFEKYADKPGVQRALAEAAAYRASMKLFEQFSRHEGRLNRSINQFEAQLKQIWVNRQELLRRKALHEAQQAARAKQSQAHSSAVTKQSHPDTEVEAERIDEPLNADHSCPNMP